MQARTQELIAYLDRQRAVLRAAFESVPAARREHTPADGGWSPAGVVEHLAILEKRIAGILSQQIVEARIAGVGEETSSEPILPTIDFSRVVNRATRIQAPEAGHPTGLGASQAWAALEAAGELFRDMLRKADGVALGAVMFPHPLFGPLSVYHWAAFTGAHEARHAAQIRETAGPA